MIRKRLVAVFLAFAVVTLAVAWPDPAAAYDVSGRFVDDDGSVFEADIESIAAEGITLGCGFRLFCPLAPVTRAQMASFLVRALELAPAPSGPFTDIGFSAHAADINALAAAGITKGCTATTFCPNSSVRRDEMASFLARGFGLVDAVANFSDIAGNPHTSSIGALAASGITKGCTATTYCPAQAVTRDQMAAFLRRAIGLPLVYPRLSLSDGLPESCTKDGLVCTAKISIPHRPLYTLSEGVYHVLPYTAPEEAAFNTEGTKVSIAIDGSTAVLQQSTVVESTRANKRFEASIAMTKGAHRIVIQWFWQGQPTKTTTVDITVG